MFHRPVQNLVLRACLCAVALDVRVANTFLESVLAPFEPGPHSLKLYSGLQFLRSIGVVNLNLVVVTVSHCRREALRLSNQG